MKWKIVAGVAIAFVIGVAGGAFAEHERVKRDRTDSTTTNAATTNWFGNRKAAACPVLKSWNAAVLASVVAVSGGKWSRSALEKQAATISTSYRSLVRIANPAGKAELGILIKYQNQATAALKEASSAAAYASAQKKLGSPRVSRAISFLLRTAKACPKR
jgi:hypothetical protein